MFLIGGREIVPHGKAVGGERNFQRGVSVSAAPGCRGEFPIARDEVDVAIAVGCWPGIGLPDAAFLRAGGNVEYAGLLQRARVVGHDPAVVRADVARRGPGDEDVVVYEEKGSALIFVLWIEFGYAPGEERFVALK